MKTGDLRSVLAVALVLAFGAGAQTVWDGITEWTGTTPNEVALKAGCVISTPEQLAELAFHVNKGSDMKGKTFTLAKDIALNVIAGERNGAAASSEPNQWVPIGIEGKPFRGVFDGAGFVVRGVYIDNENGDYQGLFGIVGKGATIKRLRVEGMGWVDEPDIKGRKYVGGLAGVDSGTTEDCHSTANVVGFGDNVGGLVGQKGFSAVKNSYATGTVDGSGDNVGGLVGLGENDTIKGCYATGDVTGKKNYVGGLVGKDSAFSSGTGATAVSGGVIVINSYYANGVVRGEGADAGNYVGGLVGGGVGGTITNCYAKGDVFGNNVVGGLVGKKIGAAIRNSYSTGEVSKSGKLTGEFEKATITYGYYRSESNKKDSCGIIPKTAKEMQSEGFVSLLNIAAYALKGDGANRWVYASGQYPRLSDEAVTDASFAACFAVGPDGSRGTGTAASPYLLDTAQHLENLAMYVNCGASTKSMYFTLLKNIFLNDTAGWRGWGPATTQVKRWTTIGQQPRDSVGQPAVQFDGTFNGDGHVVGGVFVNVGDDSTNAGRYQGLFGRVGGSIKNLGVVGSYVNGFAYVGGLAGRSAKGAITKCFVKNGKIEATGGVNGVGGIGGLVGMNSEGSIINSYSTASVSGVANMVGGLVGWNSDKSKIAYCSAVGDVIVTGDDVGGLVGRNDTNSTVTNSYAAGNVKADSLGTGNVVGGLVGINISATVDSCYAVGSVSGSSSQGGLVGLKMGAGKIDHSFYRIDALPVRNDYGTPKTKEEMKLDTTYKWDFKDVWAIDAESGSYPYLAMKRAATPTIITQPKGDSVSVGAAPIVLSVAAEPLDVTYQWFSSAANSNSNGTMIDGAVSASYSVPTDKALARYYYVVVTNTIADGDDVSQRTASVASAAVKAIVGSPAPDAVLSSGRVIPESGFGKESAAVSPPPALAAEFTAGPSPAGKSSGAVRFFRKGGRIASAKLSVYDASGNAVNDIKVEDRGASQSPRGVGSWNLTDKKGRPVPGGTYLVKGVVVGVDGKREKVSIPVGVK